MRVFAYEFITGGGLAREALPPGLAEEGECMLRALVTDLSLIPGIDVLIARDSRLPARAGIDSIAAGPGHEPVAPYLLGLEKADAVWPIAPETGGMLERLTRLAEDSGKLLLGSRTAAVAVAASKRRTAAVLAAAGIAVAPVYADPLALPDLPGPWVVKPDDGAGCVDTLRVADSMEARAALASRRGKDLVAQPWFEGEAQSLSLICRDGHAAVLSRNRQHIRVTHGRIGLHGLTVAALPVTAADRGLARAVARAMPGLWGHVGIDVVETARGPLVIEINPRLTTSYCGLASALGINVAAKVLALLDGPTAADSLSNLLPTYTLPVEIGLETCHA